MYMYPIRSKLSYSAPAIRWNTELAARAMHLEPGSAATVGCCTGRGVGMWAGDCVGRAVLGLVEDQSAATGPALGAPLGIAEGPGVGDVVGGMLVHGCQQIVQPGLTMLPSDRQVRVVPGRT